MLSSKPSVLLMGQTPPPWHGQAVATQILFDHAWIDFEVHRLRMEYSEEMLEVGRFQWKKIWHLLYLIMGARKVLKNNPGCILLYPPASARWIPFLRDVCFLMSVRHLAGSTVFIFHASGLPAFIQKGMLRRMFGRWAYRDAEVALEVAQEAVPPHDVFSAKSWCWCPCAIDVPELVHTRRADKSPLRVLFVGSLQEGKGVLDILRTAALLKQQGRQKDFRFHIVGRWFSAEFEREVRELEGALELGDMIDFAGQLTGDEKWRAYAAAEAFFFPTHYASEATPLVLMEALGAGLPIISTRWAGIPAMLEGCQTACLLPIHSPDQYASALADLFAHRNENETVARICRDFYQANFLPERFVERVNEALLSALKMPTNQRQGAKNEATAAIRNSKFEIQNPSPPLCVQAYLADQNPGYDRSFGISRMSHVVLESLQRGSLVEIETISSRTSQQAPNSVCTARILPWGTRGKWVRLLTDHLHPLFGRFAPVPDLHYFPKGYLPLLDGLCSPSVVTIHDTIIQYDEDHYPQWRKRWEYAYWAMVLKHTLRYANLILTVSEFSKLQIHQFMDRHGIPRKEITVTYEPCLYETIPQPDAVLKENYVIHLASCEPHKRTAYLVRWWHEAETQGLHLPTLHLIGSVPPEVLPLLASSCNIVKQPFLEDAALQAAYLAARALILPSEIEGFGLPALEAYYLGTPVCFVKGTSVEEILSVATRKGGFDLDSIDSFLEALDEVMHMSAQEVRECGLELRETYAAEKVAAKMVEEFRRVVATVPPDCRSRRGGRYNAWSEGKAGQENH